MSTFPGTYGSQPMLASVAQLIDKDISDQYDVHTVLLVINGQHGEFDLRVEATDNDLEDHAWVGVAHRSGGVAGFRKVPEAEAGSLGVQVR